MLQSRLKTERKFITRIGEKDNRCLQPWLALSADDWDTQMMFFLNHGYRSSP